MKRPNGYGSIVKLSGKRRKPFAVRVTLGYDAKGKQIKKYIAFTTSYKEANSILNEYNINPDFASNNYTLDQIFNFWSKKHFQKVGQSSVVAYISAFKYCDKIKNIPFKELKLLNFQEVFDEMGDKYGLKRKLKTLLTMLSNFAIKNDWLIKDYTKFIDLGEHKIKVERKPFTTEEIKRLWEVVDDMEWVDTILILIYTGFRIGEFLDIKIQDINMEDLYIKAGAKTKAGKNRIVPINSKILKLIKNRINNKNEFLICNHNNKKMKYSNYYREKFEPVMKKLNMKHKIHDTRHTFATLLSSAEANRTSISRLIGHSDYLITEKVYTHKDIEDLRLAIEKI